jgi:hypothetical protein
MLKSIEIFLNFLLQQDISHKSPNETDTLSKVIDNNFQLLNETILRALVTCALQERDANLLNGNVNSEELLGSWSEVIDVIKEVTLKRKDKATKHFQIIMKLGINGAEPTKISSCIHKLCIGGHIDYLFKGILEDTLTECQISKGHEEHAAMFQYFTNEIERINKEINDISIAVPVITNLLPSSTTSSSSAAAKVININKSGGDSDDEESDDDTDESDFDSDDENEAINVEEIQEDLIRHGTYLNSAIKTASGDVNKLKSQMLHDIRTKTINIKLLQVVLKDNLVACKKANYVNKLKLLEFITSFVDKEYDNTIKDKVIQPPEPTESDEFTTHHAPKFVDNVDKFTDILNIISPLTFIEAEGLSQFSIKEQTKIKIKKQKV